MANNAGSSKERILASAAELFAEKGFTETSVRQLAEVVGMNAASLYYHFPSKISILDHMMEDYSIFNTDVFKDKDISGLLRKNPNTDGILSCLSLAFPAERREYYIKVLCVLLQEQLRNPDVRAYVSESIILVAEENIKTIIDELKRIGTLREDTDPDYWMKIHSSLLYSFANRLLLGIGDNAPGFSGMDMEGMLRHTFDMMLETCGTEKHPEAGP